MTRRYGRVDDALDRDQAAAAFDLSQRVGIVAGAGAGKTRVLAARIAYLLDLRTSPRSIVAVTFTTRAAGELADRVGREAIADGLFAGTLHSWAYERLRERAAEVGLTPAFTVYDQEDADAIRAQCVAEVGRRDAPALFAVRCREANAVTYDGLLTLVAGLPDPWRGVAHILVDEAQDLNAEQWRLLSWASRQGGRTAPTLTCVGDYRQAIFGWRGATPLQFAEFLTSASFCRGATGGGGHHELRANYRSGPAIVETANAVWSTNVPAMVAAREDAADTYVPPETLALYEVASRCRALHASGVPWERMAVLGRTWRHLHEASDALDPEGIPHAIGRPARAWSYDAAVRLSRWIRLQTNPADDNLTALLLSEGPGQLDAARTLAREKRWTLLRAATLLGHLPAVAPDSSTEQLALLYGYVPDGMREALRRPSRRTPKAFAWWWAFGREPTAAPNAVQLLTVHGAKGLEFDAVFVLDPEGMRVEPEVLYTALTRARDRLFLVSKALDLDPDESVTADLPEWLQTDDD